MQTRHLAHTCLAVVAMSVTTAGCMTDLDLGEPIGDEAIDSTSQYLYVLSTTVWSSPTIPVCWENPTSGDATQRAWVRAAMLRTWEAVSAVTFTGWGACTSGSAGVRIRISDEGPHTKGLGDELDGMHSGMVLNFTFNNWSPGCQSQTQRQYCIESSAIHEFGHALGFAHEQNRPDTPSWCTQEQGGNGDTTVGGWDLDSIMNYCNPIWGGNGTLSGGDITGVQQFYGHRWNPDTYYRLTNEYLGDGRPLDVYGNAPNDPFMGTTGNYAGQRWKITHVGGGYYRLTNEYLGDGRPLDVYGNAPNDPFMGTTGNYAGQRWRLTPTGTGQYRLTNEYLGDGRPLDVYGNWPNDPFVGTTGNYAGQYWNVTPN